MDKKKKSEKQSEGGGLVCPRCGCRHFYTTKTEKLKRVIRRRRQCRNCGKVVTTRERIEGG